VNNSETTSSFKTIVAPAPNNGKRRNETPFVGLHAQGKLTLTSTSSCSKGVVLPQVPDNLKDRKAVFGYLFDDAAQRNYYDNMGLEGVVTQGDCLDINEKGSIVRDAVLLTKCGAGILRRTTTPGKRAILACFGTYKPPYYVDGLPLVETLTELFHRSRVVCSMRYVHHLHISSLLRYISSALLPKY